MAVTWFAPCLLERFGVSGDGGIEMTVRSAKPSLRAIRFQARIILGAVAAITLTGCATLSSEHTDQLLVAHKDGYPIDLERAALPPDTFDSTVWNPVRASID